MEHPTPTPTTVPAGSRSPNDSYVARGMAAASVGLGFFAGVVFWWTPFSGMLSGVGLVLGLISLFRGVKGGLRGENYAMVGTLLCATVFAIAITLNQALRYVQWDWLPFHWFY